MPDLPVGAQIIRLVILFFSGAAIALFLQRAVARQLRGRTRAEQLLHASQAQIAGILAIAADAIITIDDAHAIVHFNRGAEEIFGYPAAEVIGKPIELLLPESALGMHRSHVVRFAASGESARRMGSRNEVSGRRRNGEEFPAEASISKLPTGSGMLFCVVLRDATEQRRRELHDHMLAVAGARLAASLDYDATVRVAAELAVPTFSDWCVVDVIEPGPGDHKMLRRIASVHQDPERDRILRAMEHRGLDWDAPSAVIDVLRTGEPLLLPEVSEAWLEAHSDDTDELEATQRLGLRSLLIVPLLAREEVFAAMAMGRADGRRPFDEADLDLARAIGFRSSLAIDNALHYGAERRATMARDELLAIVSHDLRNPAAAISMCARALTEDPPESGAERESLMVTIRESAEWMRRLMQDLVDVASVEAGRLSVVPEAQPVEPIITSTIEMFTARAREDSKSLSSEIPASLPWMMADRSRVMQVLANLVDNALKFTHAGGNIIVSVVSRREELEFTVRDSGPGIRPEHLPHLFDRFWHAGAYTMTHGSGLGLAIARGIVTAHGGRIWVDTTLGVGSAFSFTLPIASRIVSAGSLPSRSVAAAGR
jgi:PAS domain S-box-containing protein